MDVSERGEDLSAPDFEFVPLPELSGVSQRAEGRRSSRARHVDGAAAHSHGRGAHLVSYTALAVGARAVLVRAMYGNSQRRTQNQAKNTHQSRKTAKIAKDKMVVSLALLIVSIAER
eukprot:COSAG01_NODE_19182_length_1025_cov_4.575594_1_plen_116_part_10